MERRWFRRHEDQRVAGAQPRFDLDKRRDRQGLAAGVDRSVRARMVGTVAGRRAGVVATAWPTAELLQEFLLLLGRQGLESVDLCLGRRPAAPPQAGPSQERTRRRVAHQAGSQAFNLYVELLRTIAT